MGNNMVTKRKGSIRTAKGTHVALRMETLLVCYCTLLISDQSSSLLGVGQLGWWNSRVMMLMM